jgi:hypothetical protein
MKSGGSCLQRDRAIQRLRRAVDMVRDAKQSPGLQAVNYSVQTVEWLAEAAEVAKELKGLADHLAPILRRPNEYRKWLLGRAIPTLHENVLGNKFAKTIGGQSMEFARLALLALAEDGTDDQTIASAVGETGER